MNPETNEATAEVNPEAWIGVDLDGTLAKFDHFSGIDKVGKPVKDMLKRVRAWRDAGYHVRIFTARACTPDCLPAIEKWLKKHKLSGIPVTNKLDRHCVEIWDDRAIQVKPNEGMPHRSLSITARPRAPLLEEAFPHEDRPTLPGLTTPRNDEPTLSA